MKLTVFKEDTPTTLKLTIELKLPEIDYDKFCIVCWLVGIFMVGSGVLKFFSMTTR